MNYKHFSKKVRKITKDTLSQGDLAKQVIIKKGSTFRVYDQYLLREDDGAWVVTGVNNEFKKEFGLSRSALAWCILDKSNRHALAQELLMLDYKIMCKQQDINRLTYKISLPDLDSDTADVVNHRLAEDINTRQRYKKHLLKCVNAAKHIELKTSKKK